MAASGLIQLLDQTPTGKEEAARFQKVTGAILAFALHPHLVHPELEEWINEGRKRVDIVFRNGMPSGSFFGWVVNHGLTCRFVFVECKNYGQDVHNPELDQLIGRFDPNRGKVGIMVCRRIEDWDLYVKRCRDAYRSHGGLILTLQDKDLIELAQRRGSGDPAPGEDLLYRQARDIILEAW